MVEDHDTEEDSGPKPDGKEEAESSPEEDVGMIGEVGNVDPSLGYIESLPVIHQRVFPCGTATT